MNFARASAVARFGIKLIPREGAEFDIDRYHPEFSDAARLFMYAAKVCNGGEWAGQADVSIEMDPKEKTAWIGVFYRQSLGEWAGRIWRGLRRKDDECPFLSAMFAMGLVAGHPGYLQARRFVAGLQAFLIGVDKQGEYCIGDEGMERRMQVSQATAALAASMPAAVLFTKVLRPVRCGAVREMALLDVEGHPVDIIDGDDARKYDVGDVEIGGAR